jgi:hypothetical protein
VVTISEKKMNFKSNLKLNFNGGDLTSDSGLLLYKEFDTKIGFSHEISNTLNIDDDVKHKKHENEDVILQRIYQNAAGYHADDDADDLRFDSTFQTILDKDILASQPTISRVNNKVNKENMKQLQEANFNLLDKIHTLNPPDKFIFDLDSTNCETYGDQYGSAYNYHYGADGYHPLLMFDGATGDLIKAGLRAGNVYTSRKAVRFVGPVFKKYSKRFREIPLYLRADSGFAKPGIYETSEEYSIFYAIRLKANAKLYDLAKFFVEKSAQKTQDKLYKKQVIYGQFNYKAGSWNKKRKVIVKIEKPKGQLTYNYTFIVTNIKDWSAREIVSFYCQRGTMENFIKEGKNGFAFGKMSSTEYWANANKLQQMTLAYNLNNWIRRLCFPKHNQSDRIGTIRTKLIKIAAKIVKTGRYIYYQLASSCPNKKLFFKVLDNIQNLEFT